MNNNSNPNRNSGNRNLKVTLACALLQESADYVESHRGIVRMIELALVQHLQEQANSRFVSWEHLRLSPSDVACIEGVSEALHSVVSPDTLVTGWDPSDVEYTLNALKALVVTVKRADWPERAMYSRTNAYSHRFFEDVDTLLHCIQVAFEVLRDCESRNNVCGALLYSVCEVLDYIGLIKIQTFNQTAVYRCRVCDAYTTVEMNPIMACLARIGGFIYAR